MTPIERVARALCKVENVKADDYDPHYNPVWFHYVPKAIVAIQALRDPSEKMLSAMGYTVDPACQDDGSWTWVEQAWQAGIDAALGEG